MAENGSGKILYSRFSPVNHSDARGIRSQAKYEETVIIRVYGLAGIDRLECLSDRVNIAVLIAFVILLNAKHGEQCQLCFFASRT